MVCGYIHSIAGLARPLCADLPDMDFDLYRNDLAEMVYDEEVEKS